MSTERTKGPEASEPAAVRPDPGAVTATALGSWPGTEPAEAARIIRGELGDPNLPHLAELPGRGVGSDAVGRTAAMLVELPVDLQPHGWRIVDRPGKDYRRAASALSTDINVLADVIGSEERPGHWLKVQCVGPLSLAAGLYLHNGERVLRDPGARRDVAQSLAAGIAEHLAQVRAAAPGAGLILQFDEPEAARVLAGTIPTASGYRTLRAVAEQEAVQLWRLLAEAAAAGGAAQTVVCLPSEAAPLAAVDSAGLHGFAVPVAGLSTAQWEDIAAAAEADRTVWLGVIGTDHAGGEVPQVKAIVDSVLRPWQQLGLPLARLHQVRLVPAGGLAGLSPELARRILARLGQAADALNQTVAEG
jgi:methionine synthase II (cobalamin-independent)